MSNTVYNKVMGHCKGHSVTRIIKISLTGQKFINNKSARAGRSFQQSTVDFVSRFTL